LIKTIDLTRKELPMDIKMEKRITVPKGVLSADDDAIAARRRALAEALRSGEDVVVTPSGEVEFQSEAEEFGHTAIQVPDGKLAGR
jgi:hypothetical protein